VRPDVDLGEGNGPRTEKVRLSVLRRPLVCVSLRLLPAAAATALAVAAVPAASTGADSPPLKAKRAEAAAVLDQISALDERLSVLSERYDGARVHLQTVEGRLRHERVMLTQARRQYRRATNDVARLVVSLYTSGTPSPLEAIMGAGTIGDMLTIADDEAAISHERSEVAAAARSARERMQASVAALRADRRDAARSLAQIAQTRQAAESSLGERRRLLASVQGQIAHLEAEQRARQERLLAEARARLAAERAAQARAARAAARARAEASARARAQAAAQAQAARAAAAAAETTTAAATTTAAPTSAPATTAPAAPAAAPAAPAPADPATTAPAPVVQPSAPVTAAGHPEAASLALNYIGVPYLWGGSTPAGFDCSGLVSYVYAQLGVDLPHFAAAQYGYGVPVPRDQLQAGDLVFFDGLNHVGIYIGDGEFVDAPHTGAFVRIDSLSDDWYASRYVGARRI